MKFENSNKSKKKQYGFSAYAMLVASMMAVSAPLSAAVNSTTFDRKELVQERISGRILDASLQPIVGANITIKGTNKSVSSDFDGRFELKAQKGQVLVVTSMGYAKKEVEITGATLEIVLTGDTQKLSEVVVVGFGKQKKVNLTGAVASVNVERNLVGRPVTDISRSLQGTTPGLNIASGTGNIGRGTSINIRGAGTIVNGTVSGSPLILIDGMPGDLSLLNPEDVASLSVLKDAASASIYGARAAFGVVLVTTKNGSREKDKIRFSYSNNSGWSTPINLVKFLDPEQELPVLIDAKNRAGAAPESFGMNYNTLLAGVKKWKANYAGTRGDLDLNMVYGEDWEIVNGRAHFYRVWNPHKVMLKENAMNSFHNLSAQGAIGEKSSFIASLGYSNQEGVYRENNDELKRYNINLGLTTQLADWLVGDFKVLNSISEFNYPYNYYNSGVIGSSTTGAGAGGFFGFYSRFGSYFPYGTYKGTSFRHAPGFLREASQNVDSTNDLRLQAKLTATIAEGFNVIADYSMNRNYNSHKLNGGQVPLWDWWSAIPSLQSATPALFDVANDHVSQSKARSLTHVFNAYANYNKTIKENHKIGVTAGLNTEWNDFERTFARRNTLLDRDKPEFRLAIGQEFTSTTLSGFGPGLSQYAIAGLFSRINYNYKEKYLLELNGRYDGSSRFPTDQQWGFFPSASVGYRISKENFMKFSENWLTDLKLRASYGTIGNQNIAANAFLPVMGTTTPNWIGSGATIPPGAALPSNVDPRLTWEEVTTVDYGIDVRLFDMLGITFDWYQRDTNGMLAPGKILPSTFGQGAANTNAGNLQTKGWELGVNFNKQINPNINVYADVALSDYKTVVTKWNNPTKLLTGFYEGQVLGEIWGLTTDRLIQANDVITNSGLAVNGVDYKNLRASGVFQFGAGDIMYKDLNGDNAITRGDGTALNPGDLKIIGNNTPRYQYSLRLGGVFYGFDIDAFFQGVGKRDFWSGTSDVILPFYQNTDALFAHQTDFWSPSNTDAFYPRPFPGHNSNAFGTYAPGMNNFISQTRYLLNLSYLRLKQFTLGYTLPKAISGRIGMDKIRPYVSGVNLWTLKNSRLPIDPEITEGEAHFGRTYPFQRTWSVGIQMNF
jgi:TonB-linked SusC/RagA family outer membrane protein